MSRRVTPGRWRDGGVDVAGHGDVDDQQRAAAAGGDDLLDVVDLEQRRGRAGGGEQHVDVGERGA